jgi:hypothetical protein
MLYEPTIWINHETIGYLKLSVSAIDKLAALCSYYLESICALDQSKGQGSVVRMWEEPTTQAAAQ